VNQKNNLKLTPLAICDSAAQREWHKPLDMNLIESYCIYTDILNGGVR
jgi:hypothetical protein